MSNEKDSVLAEIEKMDERWVSNNGDDKNDGATRNDGDLLA
jgi:hypothetical protein